MLSKKFNIIQESKKGLMKYQAVGLKHISVVLDFNSRFLILKFIKKNNELDACLRFSLN